MLITNLILVMVRELFCNPHAHRSVPAAGMVEFEVLILVASFPCSLLPFLVVGHFPQTPPSVFAFLRSMAIFLNCCLVAEVFSPWTKRREQQSKGSPLK